MGVPVFGKLPTRYFDAAVDYRWIYAPKIISPGQSPQQDRLNIGIIAAEELTIAEFSNRIDTHVSEQILREAVNIINPKNK